VTTAVALDVQPLTPTIGARVEGLDLREELDDDTVAAVRAAFLDHLVLFIPGQDIEPADQLRFARLFGDLVPASWSADTSLPPEVLVLDQHDPRGEGADRWHADNTYMEAPPMGSLLRAVQLPSSGGDTCFASMYQAYETLSPTLQAFLDPLTAANSIALMVERTRKAGAKLKAGEAERPPTQHPVVRVHPETGRKLLNVNANWTDSITGLSEDESKAILRMLLDHIKAPDLSCRFRWQEGDLALWDNRAVQHFAVPDYHERRVMHRVTIAGDVPVGPDGRTGAEMAAAAAA
jgi:taurine dioxygenase